MGLVCLLEEVLTGFPVEPPGPGGPEPPWKDRAENERHRNWSGQQHLDTATDQRKPGQFPCRDGHRKWPYGPLGQARPLRSAQAGGATSPGFQEGGGSNQEVQPGIQLGTSCMQCTCVPTKLWLALSCTVEASVAGATVLGLLKTLS